MMIKSGEELIIYESPDGGKTVYARKFGDINRHLHSVDPDWQKEQTLNARWARLKEAVFMADTDPVLNELIEKVEIYHELKNK